MLTLTEGLAWLLGNKQLKELGKFLHDFSQLLRGNHNNLSLEGTAWLVIGKWTHRCFLGIIKLLGACSRQSYALRKSINVNRRVGINDLLL